MPWNPATVTTTIDTTLGPVTLAATGAGLCGLWFHGQKHQPDTAAWRRDARHPWLVQAGAELTQFLHGARTHFCVPLDLSAGSAFQQAVWRALCQLPYGHTTTYGAIAQRLERPTAARAVGAAVGRNPVSVIVPCHRVLGRSGALTGYAGGLDRKDALLRLEARGIAARLVPMGGAPATEPVTIAA